MNRRWPLLVPVLALAGCLRQPFDQPDIHVRRAAQVPEEASHLKDVFIIPEALTNVYYFTPRHLRCNYYLRGEVGKDQVEQYKTALTERYSEIRELSSLPRQFPAADLAAMKDWWPQAKTQSLCVYQRGTMDFIMIDAEKGVLYFAMCED